MSVAVWVTAGIVHQVPTRGVAWLALMFAVAAFATNNVATAAVSAIGFLAARSLVSTLVAGRWTTLRRVSGVTAAYAALLAGHSLSFNIALMGLPPALAPGALALVPIVLTSHAARRGLSVWLAAMVTAGGAVMLVNPSTGAWTWWGGLALTVSLMCYGLRLLHAERHVDVIDHASAVRLGAGAVLIATVWALPSWLHATTLPVLAVAVLAGVLSAFGQRSLLIASRHLPAWVMGGSNAYSAAATAVGACLVSGVSLTPRNWVGVLLVLAGVLLTSRVNPQRITSASDDEYFAPGER